MARYPSYDREWSSSIGLFTFMSDGPTCCLMEEAGRDRWGGVERGGWGGGLEEDTVSHFSQFV